MAVPDVRDGSRHEQSVQPQAPKVYVPIAPGYPRPHLHRRGSNTPALNGCSFFSQGLLP